MVFTSARNSASPWSASLSRLIAATLWSGNTPLYTIPPAPCPITYLNPRVAFLSSLKVNRWNLSVKRYPFAAGFGCLLLLNKNNQTKTILVTSTPPTAMANQSKSFTILFRTLFWNFWQCTPTWMLHPESCSLKGQLWVLSNKNLLQNSVNCLHLLVETWGNKNSNHHTQQIYIESLCKCTSSCIYLNNPAS